MITKQDLVKISNIIREVVKEEIKLELKPIKKDIETIKATMVTKKEFNKEISRIWEELRFIRQALNATINTFDREIIKIKAALSSR